MALFDRARFFTLKKTKPKQTHQNKNKEIQNFNLRTVPVNRYFSCTTHFGDATT